MRKLIILLITIFNFVLAADTKLVKITPDISEITVDDHGSNVSIYRIQDTYHRLSDDFTKTSRTCPPFCIQPIRPVKGVQNIEEPGLIDLIANKIPAGKGLLIDEKVKKLV